MDPPKMPIKSSIGQARIYQKQNKKKRNFNGQPNRTEMKNEEQKKTRNKNKKEDKNSDL